MTIMQYRKYCFFARYENILIYSKREKFYYRLYKLLFEYISRDNPKFPKKTGRAVKLCANNRSPFLKAVARAYRRVFSWRTNV